MPMAVEIGSVTRADMSQQISVVGNLVGLATVAAAPKVSGRLETVNVRLGDDQMQEIVAQVFEGLPPTSP